MSHTVLGSTPQVDGSLSPASRSGGDKLFRTAGAVMLAFAGVAALSLATWTASDPSLTHLSTSKPANALGALGAIFSDIVMMSLGLAGILALLPPLYWACQLLSGHGVARFKLKLVTACFAILAWAATLSAMPKTALWPLQVGYGGNLGDVAFSALTSLAALTGTERAGLLATVAALACAIVLMTFALGLTRSDIRAMAEFARRPFEPDSSWVSQLKRNTSAASSSVSLPPLHPPGSLGAVPAGFTPPPLTLTPEHGEPWTTHHGAHSRPYLDTPVQSNRPTSYPLPPAPMAPVAAAPITLAGIAATPPIEPPAPIAPAPGRLIHRLPPTSLLARTSTMRATALEMGIAEKLRADRLKDVLAAFAVPGDMREHVAGPAVTSFVFEPQSGTKTARVLGQADQIAMSLGVDSVRLQLAAGRGSLLIEVPHDDAIVIGMRDLVEHPMFTAPDTALPLALGSTARGEPAIVDLGGLPSLLIAGGDDDERAGLLRALVGGLAYRHTAATLTLAIADARDDLRALSTLPHTGGHAPAVDADDAVNMIAWAAEQIDIRTLRLRTVASARSLDAYNARAEVPMPYLVVVATDIAPLVASASPAFTYALQRIARDGAAVGVHLIAATSRADEQALPEMVRSSFPTRLALKLPGRPHSRWFLGEIGAEGLCGQGDALAVTHHDDVRRVFGGGALSRLHTTRLGSDDVARIAEAAEPVFEPAEAPASAMPAARAPTPSSQPVPTWQPVPQAIDGALYDRAIAWVCRQPVVDAQAVCRALALAYPDGLALLERMADERIVSPMDADGRRRVLIGRAA